MPVPAVTSDAAPLRVAVVIPAYRETAHVLDVLARCGPEVSAIYVVDDACPEGTGRLVESQTRDERVCVLFHAENRGVGGATLTGYVRAADDGADVIVKLDADGQMDPALVPRFVELIARGEADYAKGNRFYNVAGVRSMPRLRMLGNIILSFITKASSGYWTLFDPTNGYTAIHAAVVRELPLDAIKTGFFFESDLLFHLNLLRAVVVDVPMTAVYGGETSKLRIGRVLVPFAWRHAMNFVRRIFYNYYLRSFSIASIELVLGPLLMLVGVVFGAYEWFMSGRANVFASAGTVMLAALPTILGFQLVLAFLAYDVGNVPTRPIHRLLSTRQRARIREIGSGHAERRSSSAVHRHESQAS